MSPLVHLTAFVGLLIVERVFAASAVYNLATKAVVGLRAYEQFRNGVNRLTEEARYFASISQSPCEHGIAFTLSI
jgi:hypothetical protein